MIHPETHKVTKAHGPRPAGAPDKCFYCGRSLDEEHEEDCVLRQRTVRLRVTFDIIKVVPEGWNKEAIENQFGGKWSYCMHNIAEIIGDGASNGCMCDWHISTELVEEASEEDELDWFGNILDLEEKQ